MNKTHTLATVLAIIGASGVDLNSLPGNHKQKEKEVDLEAIARAENKRKKRAEKRIAHLAKKSLQ